MLLTLWLLSRRWVNVPVSPEPPLSPTQTALKINLATTTQQPTAALEAKAIVLKSEGERSRLSTSPADTVSSVGEPVGSGASGPRSPQASLKLEESSTSEKSENLAVTRKELVKGVIIKGIVCNPKSKTQGKASSGNPFETKRTAPKPPSQADSVPKTKSKNRTH